ncbi:serine/arginine repetitive matrix protein 1-like [Abeliophyllum distichum]|uniref:Serine/arginine repetitive matrix protein 1-like n=1 Tax=Abeliophyllum distichum TaxID=126358 RepID=A0ABD1V9Z4_9LAMI
MEGGGDGEDVTPFWIQRTTSPRLRHRLSSIFFSSGLVVLLLLVTAIFFLVFVVPSTLSFSAQIFRPNNVKKSWDSLNIALVLAAIVFGFLSRNKNGDRYYDEYQTSPIKQNETQKSNPSSPRQWYDYSTNEAQKSNPSTSNQCYDQYSDNENKLSKSSTMRRTSSSYPDLREFSSNWTYGDDRRRFYDDIHVDTYHRVSDSNQLHGRRRSLEETDREREQTAKNIYVDTFARRPKEVSNTPPLPAMPPPAQKPESIEKPKRTYESVGRKKERSNVKVERNLDPGKPIAPPNIPPPPPPPPVLLPKSGRSDRKRGGATGSATKEFLNSLYHKKKKKQRQRSVDNLDSLVHQTQTPALHFQLPPPAPPPPPPPPSVFHNLFSSKKPKRKGHIIVGPRNPAPIPPPSPPKAELEPKPSAQIVPITTHNPPEPIKMNRFENVYENSNSGGESPPVPMPPPPPFFKAPAWKFVMEGDYVRIDSNASSRSGSPEPDDVDSDITPSSIQDGDTSPFHPSPAFCPSPDVNTKAESFITNFRAKLKLEKVDSMNKRELGLSNLGPGPGPS